MLHPKKVGGLPGEGNLDEVKQTNEIKMAIPLMDNVSELANKDITADAMLTQRKIATYLVEERQAHYHFSIKGNQPTLLSDVALYFADRQAPDFVAHTPAKLGHGRIETRRIWVTSELNDYLDFPHVGQAFAIEREVINKRTGKCSQELAYGITSRTEKDANAARLLTVNRGHWSIENCCHYVLDWNYDEDRGRIRTGHGPENVTRLRRFAISVIKSRTAARATSVAQKMRELHRNTRLVFDYLRMTANSSPSLGTRQGGLAHDPPEHGSRS